MLITLDLSRTNHQAFIILLSDADPFWMEKEDVHTENIKVTLYSFHFLNPVTCSYPFHEHFHL